MDDEVEYKDNGNDTIVRDMERIVQVINSRTLKRDAYDGEALFTVELSNGHIVEHYQFLKLVVPDVGIHEDMIPILKNWSKKAKEFPHRRRNCLINNKPTVRGTLFSPEHQYYQQFIDLY